MKLSQIQLREESSNTKRQELISKIQKILRREEHPTLEESINQELLDDRFHPTVSIAFGGENPEEKLADLVLGETDGDGPFVDLVIDCHGQPHYDLNLMEPYFVSDELVKRFSKMKDLVPLHNLKERLCIERKITIRNFRKNNFTSLHDLIFKTTYSNDWTRMFSLSEYPRFHPWDDRKPRSDLLVKFETDDTPMVFDHLSSFTQEFPLEIGKSPIYFVLEKQFRFPKHIHDVQGICLGHAIGSYAEESAQMLAGCRVSEIMCDCPEFDLSVFQPGKNLQLVIDTSMGAQKGLINLLENGDHYSKLVFKLRITQAGIEMYFEDFLRLLELVEKRSLDVSILTTESKAQKSFKHMLQELASYQCGVGFDDFQEMLDIAEEMGVKTDLLHFFEVYEQ